MLLACLALLPVCVGCARSHGSSPPADADASHLPDAARPVDAGPRLAFFDEHLFRPWDERCVEVRRYLLTRAHDPARLSEHLLCVLDCVFDGVPVAALPHARGVTRGTSNSDLSEIYAVFGGILGVDFLTMPYLLGRVGRGPAHAAEDPWAQLVSALPDWKQ